MWVWEFIGGLLVGWIVVSLLLSKDFWSFLYHLIFGRRVYKEPEDESIDVSRSGNKVITRDDSGKERESRRMDLAIKKTLAEHPRQNYKIVFDGESTKDDLAKLPREELAELLRNSEVRLKK